MLVYEYAVYWHTQERCYEWRWERTSFAQKKEAKRFAREKRKNSVKPYPYIIRTSVPSLSFRTNVPLEKVKKNDTGRKLIRY